MNILHTECSLNWGGQEYRTLLEHMYLNANGHQSWLMCHLDSKLYQKSVEMNAPNLIAINLKKSWSIDMALRIYFFCRLHAIDVINSHGSRDSMLCIPSLLFGIPVIRSRQIINKINKPFSYQRACTHIIASAKKIKEMLIDSKVSSEKITVVNEGIDLNEFTPNVECAYLRDEFNLGENNQVIINIGMIREDKGQCYFLDAAHLLLKDQPQLKFFLIGESSGNTQLEDALRAKIREYGIENNFIVTGYRQDIPAFMKLADLIVISSIAEAQSRIAPQAFAMGKTVVATNIGGLPEVVTNDVTGLLVPARNYQALADAIAILLQNPTLKAQLEINAYHYALENLSFAKMMDNIIQTYTLFTLAENLGSGTQRSEDF